MQNLLGQATQFASHYGMSGNHPPHSPQPQHQYTGPPSHAPPPPQVPPGWRAIWDPNAHRYYFEDEQTHHRQWEYPQQTPSWHPQYGAPPPQQQHPAVIQQQQKQSHGYGKMAMGAAGGLAAGALLDHEGHKLKEHWEHDKYRAEERISEDEYALGGGGYRREYVGGGSYGGNDYIVENNQTSYVDQRPQEFIEERNTYVDNGPDIYQTNQTYIDNSGRDYTEEQSSTTYIDDGRRDDDYVQQDTYNESDGRGDYYQETDTYEQRDDW